MGALADGYDVARKRHEDEVAEIRRKEGVVDAELHDLAALIDQDRQFLKDNGIACEVGHRILRLSHMRSPAVTVHYSAENQEFTVTVMHDGTTRSIKTIEECARAIGEALFAVVVPKSGTQDK